MFSVKVAHSTALKTVFIFTQTPSTTSITSSHVGSHQNAKFSGFVVELGKVSVKTIPAITYPKKWGWGTTLNINLLTISNALDPIEFKFCRRNKMGKLLLANFLVVSMYSQKDAAACQNIETSQRNQILKLHRGQLLSSENFLLTTVNFDPSKRLDIPK